jgi:hypothetical protein
MNSLFTQNESKSSFIGFILEAKIYTTSEDFYFINATLLESTNSMIVKNVRFEKNVCRSMFHLISSSKTANEVDLLHNAIDSMSKPLLFENDQNDKIVDTRTASAFHFDMNYTNELNDDNKIICIRAIEIIQTNDSIHRLQILPSSAAFLKFSGPSATELTLDVSSTHNTSQITSDIRIFIADFI